jgi:hypothetical protein
VIRLFYVALAGLLTFTPLMFVWAAERPRPATTGVGSRSTYYTGTHIYHSGGRGGWLGNSYNWGNGGGSNASVGGSSSYRGGGPGGGGK